MKLCFTLPGSPRTKKTHNQLVRAGGRLKVIPSQAWRTWRDAVLPHLHRAIQAMRPEQIIWFPIHWDINCKALFYRDRAIGDAVGYYQGLADILEAGGLVKDDRWIRSWDGSRLLIDRQRPRVEFEITCIPEK